MNRTPDQLTGRPAARPLPTTVDTWLAALAGHGEIGRLLEPAAELQVERGYGHTLREICQQPVTWPETAGALAASPDALAAALSDSGVSCREGALVLTGSGSSYFAAASLALPLEEALSVPASAVPAGVLLTHARALPARGRFLLVSLARSGNSPESRAIVDRTLANAPEAQHLVITCNRSGALATAYDRVPGVRAVVLDEKRQKRAEIRAKRAEENRKAMEEAEAQAPPAEEPAEPPAPSTQPPSNQEHSSPIGFVPSIPVAARSGALSDLPHDITPGGTVGNRGQIASGAGEAEASNQLRHLVEARRAYWSAPGNHV